MPGLLCPRGRLVVVWPHIGVGSMCGGNVGVSVVLDVGTCGGRWVCVGRMGNKRKVKIVDSE
jgi:hypothetical protein